MMFLGLIAIYDPFLVDPFTHLSTEILKKESHLLFLFEIIKEVIEAKYISSVCGQ